LDVRTAPSCLHSVSSFARSRVAARFASVLDDVGQSQAERRAGPLSFRRKMPSSASLARGASLAGAPTAHASSQDPLAPDTVVLESLLFALRSIRNRPAALARLNPVVLQFLWSHLSPSYGLTISTSSADCIALLCAVDDHLKLYIDLLCGRMSAFSSGDITIEELNALIRPLQRVAIGVSSEVRARSGVQLIQALRDALFVSEKTSLREELIQNLGACIDSVVTPCGFEYWAALESFGTQMAAQLDRVFSELNDLLSKWAKKKDKLTSSCLSITAVLVALGSSEFYTGNAQAFLQNCNKLLKESRSIALHLLSVFAQRLPPAAAAKHPEMLAEQVTAIITTLFPKKAPFFESDEDLVAMVTALTQLGT
jgi:hypothetical protein